MLEELWAFPYRRKEYETGDMVVRVGNTCDWLLLLVEGRRRESDD